MEICKIERGCQVWHLLKKEKEILVLGKFGDIPYYQYAKTVDIESALHCVYNLLNIKDLDPLNKDDLRWHQFAECSGVGCDRAESCYRTRTKNESFVGIPQDCISQNYMFEIQWKAYTKKRK